MIHRKRRRKLHGISLILSTRDKAPLLEVLSKIEVKHATFWRSEGGSKRSLRGHLIREWEWEKDDYQDYIIHYHGAKYDHDHVKNDAPKTELHRGKMYFALMKAYGWWDPPMTYWKKHAD